jgi:hypothetical protein
MDLEINIFHYSIPKELIELILSKFLCHKDVCRFDTAMCNTKKRRLFIENIRSNACAWQVDINQQIKSKEISWLNSRKIKIRSLYCNTLSRNTIAKLGHSIVLYGCCSSLSIVYIIFTCMFQQELVVKI